MSPSVVLAVASLAVFMAFLDDSVVAIAFPDMLRSFHGASITALAWVFNAYNITFAAFLLPAGLGADLLGRRRVFAFGVTLFTLASALCAAAPSVGVLIGARALQGAGAAVLVPASLALVLEAHPAGARARAVGAWAATAAVAAGLGPTIGGVLVEAYSWRLVFLVNVPIGILVRHLAGRELVESRAPGRRELPDAGGAVLLAASVCAIALAIAEGPAWGWVSPGVIAAALTGLGGATLLVRRVRTHPAPLLDVELLSTPRFPVVNLVTLAGSAGFFALGLANVIFLMDVWGYSPLTAGLALTPAPFIAAPTALLAGRLVLRWDSRKLVALGAIILACGAALLVARMGSEPDFLGAYLPAALLLAVGIGLAFPLVSDTAVSAAPRSRFAGATAFNTSVRLIGGALGVAVLAALVGKGDVGNELDPFREAWVFAGACFAAVAVVALALPRSRPGALDSADAPVAEVPRMRSSGERPPSGGRPVVGVPMHPSTPAELLASVALFATLPAELLRSLAARTTSARLESGDWLFREGEAADSMYVVQSGRLEVLLPAAPGDGVVRELGVGAAVGELALLSGAPRSASVRCRRDAELLRLAREDLERLMEGSPDFAPAVASALAAQLQGSVTVGPGTSSTSSTIALLALTEDAVHSGLEPALVAELARYGRMAHVDRDTALASHEGVTPGGALARTLDHLERDHELILVSADAADVAWSQACVDQSDRVLLALGEAPGEETLAGYRLAGCDALLLGAAGTDPACQALLDRLAPRSTQPVAAATFEADVARLARRLTSRAVGLVLSGGGARALAHIGVIEELVAAGVLIDRVGGASMGAFIGALLAQGLDPAEIDARCYEEWVRRSPLADYGLPRHSLLRGARLRAMLERRLPGLLECLPLPFYCTAVDAVANELVVQRRGPLALAVAASMAVPGVLPPVIRDGRMLFDGAVIDGLPVSVMARDGEGPIIACDVSKRGLRETPGADGPRAPSLIDTLANLAFLTTADPSEEAGSHADLLIAPEPEDVGALEFHMIDTMREAGRRAARSALERTSAEIF